MVVVATVGVATVGVVVPENKLSSLLMGLDTYEELRGVRVTGVGRMSRLLGA